MYRLAEEVQQLLLSEKVLLKQTYRPNWLKKVKGAIDLTVCEKAGVPAVMPAVPLVYLNL